MDSSHQNENLITSDSFSKLLNRRIDLHEKLSESDIQLIKELITSLEQNPSKENLVQLSSRIPKDRMDIGAIITYHYGAINHLELQYPLILESLQKYDDRLMDFSNDDIQLLEQILETISLNEEESRESLQKAISLIPEGREDLQAMIYILYWSKLFGGMLMFLPKKKRA